MFTGLPAGDLILPVRLPSGSGQFPRLAHFLADPTAWHKIDLVRVRDSKAPGGWRYYAHLLVLQAGWQSPRTRERRANVPTDRVGGVDVNVSSLATVSLPDPHDVAPRTGDADVLLVDYDAVTDRERASAARAAVKLRRRQKALDRSRRASNPGQYQPSARQAARAQRRAAAGLPARIDSTPTGPRVANTDGIPTRAYRKDTLTAAYRRGRDQAAADARSVARAKTARAQDVAARIVARHGNQLVTENVNVTAWAKRWGRGVALFTPGQLTTALMSECAAAGGRLVRAGTHLAHSQHCICGRREKKTLARRTHTCPDCRLTADRDLLAAALAATVVVADPTDPSTARVDPILHAALQRRVAAQQEALHRSTAASGNSQAASADPAGHGSPPLPDGPLPVTQDSACPTPEQTPPGDVTGPGSPRNPADP